MIKYFLLALCCFFWPVTGNTHPHIWSYTSLELLVEQDKIVGIRTHWSFDALYSASFLIEADANQNKKLDPEEAAKTVDIVFTQGEKDLYPFMFVAPQGKRTPFRLTEPKIWMSDESLNYSFNIILTEPQPLVGRHEFGIYDPEFYVAFEQDLDMKLPPGVTCTQDLQENKNISIYFDLVNPETYTLTCR